MGEKAELPALTGLRFFAALTIVIEHSVTFMLPFQHEAPVWHIALNRLGGIGMPLFFTLSGFVIHYNYSTALRSIPRSVSMTFSSPGLLVSIRYSWQLCCLIYFGVGVTGSCQITQPWRCHSI